MRKKKNYEKKERIHWKKIKKNSRKRDIIENEFIEKNNERKIIEKEKSRINRKKKERKKK